LSPNKIGVVKARLDSEKIVDFKKFNIEELLMEKVSILVYKLFVTLIIFLWDYIFSKL
jgi:hypothetical protein